ncbi:hypothetical protein LWI29_019718 [Acer saccharum]|uniref:SMC hinge domain-containing protein n=1 Tax=Acer saccharum TaxID=4024 RepID=A0AA39VZX9_ACESA|nr:hypothetical protein LWI29_019718 [Acer saccharum]
MYIKEICLEGFKSYASRTVVPGFDPYFNAITGLNGSGKSNILDSICFVLGITNLQQVRALNLQELVYKQGQAGITKATVLIVFDNSDRRRSPLGYEDHPEITVTRQIVVGGRKNILSMEKLHSLIKSRHFFIQYNLCNNLHFLIMQGRITKVLNMKPPEILSMLEEAAGTRIAELDRLRRFCIAYEYVQAEKIRDSAVDEVEQVKAKIAEIDENTERTRLEILEMEKQVSNLTAEKEASMGGEVKILSDKVDKLSQGLVLEVSVLNNKDDNLRSEKENAKKRRRPLLSEGAADLKRRVEELSKSLEEYEKDYQGVLAGKISGNEEKCLEDQLGDAKVAVGSAETELKQLKTKISHCEKELKEKRHQLLSKREETAAAENELNARRKDVEKVKLELESDRAFDMELVQKLKDEIRDLSAQLSNVQFSYRDPVKNFDRSKVKGVVAKLIKVKNSSTMTALEVTAGGRLYNVIVDTENTGKQLLQHSDLRRRVTIIPLNKIQSHTVPPRVQQAAVRLVGKENAELALSLVGYSDELKTQFSVIVHMVLFVYNYGMTFKLSGFVAKQF